MAKLDIVAGATSVSLLVFVQDSSKTTGAGLTGLVYNSSGLTCYYALPRAASTAVTLATLAAVTSAYSSGGFKEVDSTNMPGIYRLDIPNAALASGRYSTVYLQGATNMAPVVIEISLTGVDNQDSVRYGMTALPNVASGAVGAIPVSSNFQFHKNTAFNNFQFMMFSSTSPYNPATGLTVTAQRSIDGGAFANCTNAVSELSNGWYTINLSGADLNASSSSVFKMTATGAKDTGFAIFPLAI